VRIHMIGGRCGAERFELWGDRFCVTSKQLFFSDVITFLSLLVHWESRPCLHRGKGSNTFAPKRIGKILVV
jgi:hypothetical protein